MDTIESIIWLKRNNLFNKCVSFSQNMKVVFSECFKVKDEDVLVIGDVGKPNHQVAPIYAGACFLAARALNLNAKLVFQQTTSGAVGEDVKKSLEMVRPKSLLVLSLSGRIGEINSIGKPFKQFCKEKRLRYASTPSLGTLNTNMTNTLVNAVNVDYKAMHWLHSEVKKIIDEGEVLHIKTKAGTDLGVSIKGVNAISSDGHITKEGFGGNLPAGEVYLAPAKNKTYGKVVVDCSSRNKEGTVLVKEPITLIIDAGEVVEVKGGREARMLLESMNAGEERGKNTWGHRMIGEVGIGLNPHAKICGSMIIDEKVKGTAHVAIGSNSWFGGTVYAAIHLDQVFKDPEITVDGKFLRV